MPLVAIALTVPSRVGAKVGTRVFGRQVEGGDVAARLAVDRREVATDVEAGAVGGRVHDQPLRVEDVVEGRDGLPVRMS